VTSDKEKVTMLNGGQRTRCSHFSHCLLLSIPGTVSYLHVLLSTQNPPMITECDSCGNSSVDLVRLCTSHRTGSLNRPYMTAARTPRHADRKSGRWCSWPPSSCPRRRAASVECDNSLSPYTLVTAAYKHR